MTSNYFSSPLEQYVWQQLHDDIISCKSEPNHIPKVPSHTSELQTIWQFLSAIKRKQHDQTGA
jgi:hypothetical protein